MKAVRVSNINCTKWAMVLQKTDKRNKIAYDAKLV